ncbi:MAG: hypothetical protein A2W86_10655 [Bacteroidetes bacterium GWD2_45_23]|nr:MAG: hypothetical protein A2W87_10610 [Bacteroidetes bacterium GWC2_46_850]OFX85076.1 MAG: hypothetical protein A2W86_10655 [Bacteroidetes bacterium GWD2_45_23]HBB00390.1 hypothetical protein [Porphyromonadaceae bacterium]HCC18411.1 hypothetical protein [Porphyromonadaceae bacterium]
MDYRKINSHIILLLIVSIAGLAIAMVGRLIVLEKGFDIGTANLTFVIILGVCLIVYLIIMATLAHVIVPWIMKKLPNKKRPAVVITDDNFSNEEKRTQKPSIEDIRKDAEKRHIEKQNEEINLFIEYSHVSMAPYITDDELLRLDKYIEYYAREEPLPDNLIPIKPNKLKNPDMFHFGWNMAHYFGYDKQDVVPWLRKVFLQLRDLEPSYIKGKLYDGQTRKYIIPNIDDIPKYLAE